MGFLSRLFACAVMTTAENRYHLSGQMAEKGLAPGMVQKLYARQELFSGLWTVYSVTDFPLRPTMSIGYRVYENGRWGTPKVEARHLSLTEAYNRLAAHEEKPQARRLVLGETRVVKGADLGPDVARDYLRHIGVPEDGRAFLQQAKPAADDPAYWRNWTHRLPAP